MNKWDTKTRLYVLNETKPDSKQGHLDVKTQHRIKVLHYSTFDWFSDIFVNTTRKPEE